MSEQAWRKWQDQYSIRRTKAYRHILEVKRAHIAEAVMKKITVLSNARDCVIELTHGDTDPGMWIVRHATRLMWFKKRVSSHWFNDEHQAMAFADELKKKHAPQ